MNRVQKILGVLLLVGIAIISFRTEDCVARDDVYYNEQFLLVEEDKVNDRFYALIKERDYYKYVQYVGSYDQVFVITNLFEIERIIPNMSGIDVENRRYYFVTVAGKKMVMNVLDLDTGELLKQKPLRSVLIAFEYDYVTQNIIALARTRTGQYSSVRINPYSLEEKTLFNIRYMLTLDPTTAYIHEEKQELWISGTSRSKNRLTSISIVNGRTFGIDSKYVGIDEVLVYNYNVGDPNKTFYTLGGADSIIVVGRNNVLKIAFLAHFTINSTNVKERMEQINKELQEFALNGMNDLDIQIVSGKPFENFLSYSRALALENKIKEKYGVEKIKKHEFFFGKPYNVIFTADEVIVY